MTWLIGLLVPRIGVKGARYAAYAMLAVGLALLLWGAKCAYDGSIIRRHDDKQNQKVIVATGRANESAAEQRGTDNARLADEKREAQEAIEHAKANGTDPRAAYYHCVELQQRARQARSPAPQCG